MNQFALATVGAALMAGINLSIIFIPSADRSISLPPSNPQMPDKAPATKTDWPDVPISQRLLFAPPEREAQSPVEPAPPTSTPSHASPFVPKEAVLQVVGIAGVDPDRFALLQIEGQSELRKVIEGEEVEGWRIGFIGQHRLEIRRNGEKKILHLDPPP